MHMCVPASVVVCSRIMCICVRVRYEEFGLCMQIIPIAVGSFTIELGQLMARRA